MFTVCPYGACTGWSTYTVPSVAVNQPVAPLPLPSTVIFSVRYVHIDQPATCFPKKVRIRRQPSTAASTR